MNSGHSCTIHGLNTTLNINHDTIYVVLDINVVIVIDLLSIWLVGNHVVEMDGLDELDELDRLGFWGEQTN